MEHGGELTAPDARLDPRRGGARRSRSAGGVVQIVSRLREDPRWRRASSTGTRCRRARRARRRIPRASIGVSSSSTSARGMRELYAHQARVVELALDRRDVLVATPTASGKTLCYSAAGAAGAARVAGQRARAVPLPDEGALAGPVAGADVGGRGSSAQRLARVHLRRRHAAVACGARCATAGTSCSRTRTCCTPGILPNHAKWSELFRDLRYVVIDEVHTLSGVFGSSVANVLRRLVRIARHYGSDPRFLLSSATLREPREHARRSARPRRGASSTEDGSPSGARTFGVYNPPMLEPRRGPARERARGGARARARPCAGRRTRRSSSAAGARPSRC